MTFGCRLTALIFAGMLPAFATASAGPSTEAFLANVRENSDFLSRANVVAAERAKSQELRDFAAKSSGQAGQYVVADRGDVATGRSVAVDMPLLMLIDPNALEAPTGAGVLMPAAGNALTPLIDAQGEAFDTLYKAAQADALTALINLYDAYGDTGEDVDLRALAIQELPKLEDRLANLQQL